MSDEIKNFFCQRGINKEIGHFELQKKWKMKNRHIPEQEFIKEPENNISDKVSLAEKNFSKFTFLYKNDEKEKIINKNSENFNKTSFNAKNKYPNPNGFSLDKFLFDLENENNLSDNIKNRFEIFEDSYKAIKENSRKIMNLQNVNKIYSQKISTEIIYQNNENEINYQKKINYENEIKENKNDYQENDYQNPKNYENIKSYKNQNKYENNNYENYININNYQNEKNFNHMNYQKNNKQINYENNNNQINYQNNNEQVTYQNNQKNQIHNNTYFEPKKLTSLDSFSNNPNLIQDLKQKNCDLYLELKKTKKELNMIILGQSTLISQYEKYIQSLQIKNDDLLNSQNVISQKQFEFLEENKKLDKELQKKNFNSSVIEKNYKSKIIELSFEKKNLLEKIIKLQDQLENLKNEKNEVNDLNEKLDKLKEERENFISESKNTQSTIASLNSKFESTKEELMIYKIKEKKEKSENEKLVQEILDLKKTILEDKKKNIKEKFELKKKIEKLENNKLKSNQNLLLSKGSVKNSEKNYFNMAKKISTTPKKPKSSKDKILKNSIRLKQFDILSLNKEEPIIESIQTSIIKGGLTDYLNNNEFSIKKTSSSKKIKLKKCFNNKNDFKKNPLDFRVDFNLGKKEKSLKKIPVLKKEIIFEKKEKEIKKENKIYKDNNLNIEYYNGLKMKIQKKINENSKKSYSQPQRKYKKLKSNITFNKKNSKLEIFGKNNLKKTPYYLNEENVNNYQTNYCVKNNNENERRRTSNNLRESKRFINNKKNVIFDRTYNKENRIINLKNEKEIIDQIYLKNEKNQNYLQKENNNNFLSEKKKIEKNYLQKYIQKKISRNNLKNLRSSKKVQKEKYFENPNKKYQIPKKIERFSINSKQNEFLLKNEKNNNFNQTKIYNKQIYRRVIRNNNDRSVSEPRYYYSNRNDYNHINDFQQF